MTGLRDSHTRVIASKSIARTSISFKDLPLFYVMIRGSLNISLSFKRTFSQSRAVIVRMSVWLPLLSACDLQSFTLLFFASFFFSLGSFILQDMFRLSQMLALEGQSLKYSREHVGYLHFV